VWTYGGGPNRVLAIHGLAGSGRYWAGLSAALGPGYTVVAPDLAGFGASDKPRDHKYSRAQHIDDLQAVITEILLGDGVTIVGHSMGGILAGLLTARDVVRVQRLALVAAPYPHGRGLPPRLAHNRDRDLQGHGRPVYRTVVALWPLISFFVRLRAYPHAVITDYLKHTPQSYWATATSLIWSADTATELESLEAFAQPSLLLFSEEDRTISRESAANWAALLPAAERRYSTGGHQLLLRTHFAPLADWLTQQRLETDVSASSSDGDAA
jgi:pimeloyl-ACP methyl ester carboxylesterase